MLCFVFVFVFFFVFCKHTCTFVCLSLCLHTPNRTRSPHLQRESDTVTRYMGLWTQSDRNNDLSSSYNHSVNRLDGLVLKASTSSALALRWSITSDWEMAVLVAALSDVWRYKVSTRTGWSSVSILFHLLLLHSQVRSLRLTILGEIFAYVTVFFWFFFLNPTIEVVTFRLRGWCMLGVSLLPAFTCLGHECHDLLSTCNGMHVCTD